jgi:hypothetical protein
VLENIERHEGRDIILLVNPENQVQLNDYVTKTYKPLSSLTRITTYLPPSTGGITTKLIEAIPGMYSSGVLKVCAAHARKISW